MPGFFCAFLFFVFSCFAAYTQSSDEREATQWADSVMRKMTLEEKIGQLFMLATFSNKDEAHYQYIDKLITSQRLGGLIFMQGDPESQARLVNRYQKLSPIPLLIAQDAEWGLGMRLKGTKNYPKNMTLGAIRNDSLLYKMGASMASELRAVGVTVNFAPDVDVNNNPANPVINYRSFGENKYNVARKGVMISHGMQDNGVLACAKHFPGHGDTDADSHFDLPVIPHDITRLDTLELYPFSRLMEAGIAAVMVGHLYVPALDSTPNVATSISRRVVHGLLRDSMGYEGLIFTDALNMHGVAKYYPGGEVALRAFQAGNDVLLFPSDIPRSAVLIREAVENGEITEKDLEKSVKRILLAKYRVGLEKWLPLDMTQVLGKVQTAEADLLRTHLYESAVTLAQNQGDLLPLRNLEKRKIACVQVGGSSGNSFELTLKKYGEVKFFYLSKNFTEAEKTRLLSQLEGYDTVILGVLGMNNQPSENFGVAAATATLSKEISAKIPDTILALFGNAYALKFFGSEDAVVVGYEAVGAAQRAVAMAIFGGIRVDGRLPVTASEQFYEGMGVVVAAPIRFGFATPETQKMDGKILEKIDSIASHYIQRQAVPGCAILVMKGNNIVYDKAFGKMDYTGQSTPIDSWETMYDLASVTKIAATTLCTMHLVEQGKLDLDAPISRYLPDLQGSNKANLTIRRLLQHNAGLPSWIPFHQETYKDESRNDLSPVFYSYTPSRSEGVEIAPSLYGTDTLARFVWQKIRNATVRNTERVRYSDVGMILMGKIIESVTEKTLDTYMDEWLYRPLGMNRTMFNPGKKGLASICPPTEADTTWRNAIVKGYVHDPASAIMGGVAGHAGLFSNVYDLAKLMLMVKSGGSYGGENYFRSATIEYFTKKQLDYNRKGLGWDKPEISAEAASPVSDFASTTTYGHTGFTGTCVWVDPSNDLVYIFLSNRTFPYPDNHLLMRENVRTVIMDKIYESLRGYDNIYTSSIVSEKIPAVLEK
ncbi:MAG: glycoside hydrolase family 3 N-terminal domain-containing protein [Bacteroidia bacterium]|nr:glycoside hydrolase family 3 N-terminal domain-containing protein [Bacteroidia bacterium]